MRRRLAKVRGHCFGTSGYNPFPIVLSAICIPSMIYRLILSCDFQINKRAFIQPDTQNSLNTFFFVSFMKISMKNVLLKNVIYGKFHFDRFRVIKLILLTSLF